MMVLSQIALFPYALFNFIVRNIRQIDNPDLKDNVVQDPIKVVIREESDSMHLAA